MEEKHSRTTDLNTLFDQAIDKLRPSRILLVFDQFEEFLILHEEQQRRRFIEFLTTQAGRRESASAILLVFRAEYDGFIQELNLPAPIYGQNLQKVSAFTQRAAQDFLAGSGLKIQEELLAGVLREAAEVEETRGMIRPVTLNLCGLVLRRFSTGLPHSFRPGRLIRGFVREAIFDKEIREATPIFLRKLISHEITKRPCTTEELSESTTYTARQAQGVMFKLSEPERGIVHALDADHRVWEISHDFLVPMIDAMLANWRVSLWRKTRPWVPIAYLAILLVVLYVAPRLVPDPLRQLNDLHWHTHILDRQEPNDRELLKQGIRYELVFDRTPPPESVRAMKRIREPFSIRLRIIHSFDVAHFESWKDLTQLKRLDLYRNQLSDVSGLSQLPRCLNWLNLSSTGITDSDLKYLPGSLTSLYLNSNHITDAGLKYLSRLPSLTSLEILGDEDITDAGLSYLPQSLTSLELSDNHITNEGLKNLPRSLTSLDLSGTEITDAGPWYLQRLPSLTTLDLSLTETTDAGLRNLPSSVKVTH
jgi:hypothetical protein